MNTQTAPKIAKRDGEGLERIARKLSREQMETLLNSLYPETVPPVTPEKKGKGNGNGNGSQQKGNGSNGNGKVKNSGSDDVELDVYYEGNWTWLVWSEKPSEKIRSTLKKRYPSAQFSDRRTNKRKDGKGEWYITEKVTTKALSTLLGIAVTEIKK